MKTSPGTATRISSPEQARQLGQRITDPQRRHPFVVITMDRAKPSSFDADEIAAALRVHADVWVVGTELTWDLNERLGSYKVFGDSAAVYPPIGDKGLRSTLVRGPSPSCNDQVVSAAREAVPGRAARSSVATRAAQQSSTTPRPDRGLHLTDTPAKVDALAHHLLDPTRDHPVAVITVPSNRTEPWIDPQEVVSAVGSEAEVHLLETGPRTFQLTSHLNRMAGVYGGAGRVYDVGQEWLEYPYLSPLRFAYDQGEGGRACADLINDLIGALARTGHLTTESAVSAQPVVGKVTGLIPPSRAIVRLEDGEFATIWAELVRPGLDIGALVARGMPISGRYDPGSRRVDITQMLQDHIEMQDGLTLGEVVAASVARVNSDEVVLVPYPGVTAVLSADMVTGNDLDDLTELLTRGEVVAARYLGPGVGATSWALSMVDVDDDEPVVPLTIVDGGPAWLTVTNLPTTDPLPQPEISPEASGAEEQEQERLQTALREAEERLADLSAESVQSDGLARRNAEIETQLSSRDLEVDALRRDLREALRRVASLERQVEHERTAKRRAVQKSNKSKSGSPREVLGFADPEKQLRWDIQRTWVEHTRPEDKDEWRLADDYEIGPEFCATLDGTQGVSRDRVLQVLVRLLTGRGVPGDHHLRTNKSGNSPAVSRTQEDIEWRCRRAPLQQSSPSARRLSYWQGPSGQIKLSRITVHDDLTP